MTRIFARALALWLPLLVVLTGTFLFGSWAVQQTYREGLDDPQIQMAEDAAQQLSQGAEPASVVPTGASVDMSASLLPWLAVYDASGTPLASSGLLDGALPELPPGTFDVRTWNRPVISHHLNRSPMGENRISWQPRYANAPGGEVRQAVVLVHYDSSTGGGYVAAGRNMRVVEMREGMLHAGTMILYGATALGTLLVIVALLALGWL